MTEIQLANWNLYWGEKMKWQDFVNFVYLETPPQTLMTKLGMSRRAYYHWRKLALEDIKSEV